MAAASAYLTPTRRRAIAHGFIVAGVLWLLYLFLVIAPRTGTFGHDAFAYWNVSLDDTYALPWLHVGSFPYSPPIAVAFQPFGLVDWPTFSFLWLMLLVGSVIWLAGTPLLALAAFAFLPVGIELYAGNIHILLAVAVVLGFRHPWTWSFVLLTKPSAGVGLLWFAVRREWRQLGIALGTTAVLALGVALLRPDLWAGWVAYVSDNLGQPAGANAIGLPLWLRLAGGALLVVWGARTDRRWTVVVAATLALPMLWFSALAMLIGVIPELREQGTGFRAADLLSRLPGGSTWRRRFAPGAVKPGLRR